MIHPRSGMTSNDLQERCLIAIASAEQLNDLASAIESLIFQTAAADSFLHNVHPSPCFFHCDHECKYPPVQALLTRKACPSPRDQDLHVWASQFVTICRNHIASA